MRRGRTYRRIAHNGDQAIVNFQGSTGLEPDDYAFHINIGVSPRPWSEYVNADQIRQGDPPYPEPHVMNSLYGRRVKPPDNFRWTVTIAEGAETTWRILEEPLSTAVAQLTQLLDRETFLEYVEHGGAYVHPDVTTVRCLLRADSASDEQMTELLAAVERRWPEGTHFVSWMHAYRAARDLPATM